jgi:hypothetical protein
LVSQALQQFCDGKVGLSYTARYTVEQRVHRIIQQSATEGVPQPQSWTTLFEARVVIGDFKEAGDHSSDAICRGFS